jgi:hypothetical protein
MPKAIKSSKPPSLPTTMRHQPWNGNWFYGWPVSYGGCGGATTMETGLFEIQAEHLNGFRRFQDQGPCSRDVIHMLLRCTDVICTAPDPALHGKANATEALSNMGAKPLVATAVNSSVELARRFLCLANLPNFVLDRLSRYEATLWRRIAQVLFALDALDRHKPHERRRCPARQAGACRVDGF